jgi:hypothetical protein
MDVVQWLVPDREGAVGVCFAPAWADRLPGLGDRPGLRRRSAPLVSRHLSRPLAIAVAAGVDDDDSATTLPDEPGRLAIRLSLSVEGEPILAADADDVRFASVLGEFIGVVIDLCEAAGLPVMGALPSDERRALVVVLGSLRGQTRSRLADALLLLSAAVQMAALARGFSVGASLEVSGATPLLYPIDGRLEEAL